MVTVRRSLVEELEKFFLMDRQTDVYKNIIEYSLDEHRAFFHDPKNIYLTIVDEQEAVAGYFILVLEDPPNCLEFRRIVIDENKRGIGQEAIRLMEKYCTSELRIKKIWLDVFEHNQRGQYIYRKLGYRKVREGDYRGEKLLFFEKSL